MSSRPVTERMAIRFSATLAANLIRVGLSFVSGVLVARGLGVSGYGDLNFLMGSFAAISHLLEMGTSSAFYTFISQRQRSRRFMALYLAWLAGQFVVTAVVVGLLLPAGTIARIWVGQARGMVLLAFAASFLMTQAWAMVDQLGEATRRTVLMQVAAVIQGVAHLVLVVAAVSWRWLTVPAVLWMLIVEHALLALAFGPRLVRANVAAHADGDERVQGMVKEFAAYCQPLVVYGWVGMVYAFADRWLLQQFGGAIQQGFFAVGQQFANVSLIATTSLLSVLWKELAEARQRQDQPRMERLYTVVRRGLYATGAWISCLCIPYSREILRWTVGATYESAWMCLSLMLLVPIHQSLGQIQATYFYASGNTKTYTRLSMLIMGVSLPATYIILAPRSAFLPGLGLGAVGLAAKLVMVQMVGVSLQAHVIAKANGWAYDYNHQATVLGSLWCLGWTCKWIAQWVLGGTAAAGSLEVVGLGGGMYGMLSFMLLCCAPSVVGVTREQIQEILASLIGWARQPSA